MATDAKGAGRFPPTATEYALILEPRPDQPSALRPGGTGLTATVALFAARYPALDLARTGASTRTFVDERRGIVLTIEQRGRIVVRLLACRTGPRLEESFDRTIRLAAGLAAALDRVVWDPARRLAVHPGPRFEEHAIAVLRSGVLAGGYFRARAAAA